MFYTRTIPIYFEQIVSICTQIQTNSKTGSKFGNHGERSKHGEHVKDGKPALIIFEISRGSG